MNESGKNENLIEGIVVVSIVFLVLIFAIYRFGGNKQSVTNPETNGEQVTAEELNQRLEIGGAEGSENELYYKYVKKIYDAKKEGGDNANVDTILSDYKNELENKVIVPTQNVTIKNVNASFDKKIYLNSYESLYLDLQKKGGNSESKIFAAQIVDSNTLLPLSDYDKETLTRIALEYEIFAENIQNLNTPQIYLQKSKQTAENALKVAYIIRQVININDKQIYALWINKYSEAMFDIIANRYAS